MKQMDKDVVGQFVFDQMKRWLEEEGPIAKRLWDQTTIKMVQV
jgi:hypothetical protein